MTELTRIEREQIAEVMDRRANEIAGFADEYRRNPGHYGSVELALWREIKRLRNLSQRVCPPNPTDETPDPQP